MEICEDLTNVLNIPIYKDLYAEKNTFLIGKNNNKSFIIIDHEMYDKLIEIWNERFINDERYRKLKEI